MNKEAPNPVMPSLADCIVANPGWLDEAVEPHEAGIIVCRSVKALGILRVRGGGPPFLKCGRTVRYIRRDLFEWLKAHRVNSTSQMMSRQLQLTSGSESQAGSN